MKNRLQVGLVGCGDIGALRAAALGRTRSCQLAAVCDVARERVARFARQYGGRAEADFRALLRRDDVEAVIISTPPDVHAQLAIDALASGKHVLCEKPLARTADECRAVVEAAARHDRFLATGFNYRFYPSIRKARSLFDSGLIGDLDHIRSYAGYSAADHSHPWLHSSEVMGGGALRDNGIHLIDLTRYFLGDVTAVAGFTQDSVWGFPGCEDNGFALLRNREGKTASLQASWTEWRGYRFLVEIYGTRGCIRASCFPMMTQAIWSQERGSRTRRKTYLFPGTHLQEHLRSYRWVVMKSFVRELESFASAVSSESSEIASGWDGMRAVQVAEEISNFSKAGPTCLHPTGSAAPRTVGQSGG